MTDRGGEEPTASATPSVSKLEAYHLIARIYAKGFPSLFRPRRRGKPGPGIEFSRSEYRNFSQHGEDGILQFLLGSVGCAKRTFVEFGFSPSSSNCLNLLMRHGFSGLFMDGSTRHCERARAAYRCLGKTGVQVKQAFITRDNVNELIGASFTGEIDVLSLDVDGNDYWLWQTIDVVSPRIAILEYNASFGPERSITIPYDPGFAINTKQGRAYYHGASLAALSALGEAKGYRLVGCDRSGVNAFFLRSDLPAEGIPTVSPQTAFLPHRRRTLKHGRSVEEQWATVQDLDYVTV